MMKANTAMQMMIGVCSCSAVKQGMMQQIMTMEMIVHVEASHRDLYFMGFVSIVDELKLVVANVVSRAKFCNSRSKKRGCLIMRHPLFIGIRRKFIGDESMPGSICIEQEIR